MRSVDSLPKLFLFYLDNLGTLGVLKSPLNLHILQT
jgi:hypothetical protein